MFTDKENWEISKLLASILHMGNLRYEGTVKIVGEFYNTVYEFVAALICSPLQYVLIQPL